MIQKKYHLIIILSFLTFNIQCQKLIVGIVLDAQERPIPYASVNYVQSGIGVITNEEGRFSIQNMEASDLVIRSLGYKTQHINTDTIQQNLRIVLKSASIDIEEVKILPVDVESIMKEVIKNIPKNYPKKKVRLHGLYKQATAQNQYLNNIFESDVNIYLTGMGQLKKPKLETKIINYEYYKVASAKFKKPQGYLYTTCLYFHPIIHAFDEYKFEYDYQFDYEGGTAIKINLEPKNVDKTKRQYNGVVCVDKETKGILFMEYSLISNEIEMKRANGLLQRREKSNTKVLFTKAKPYFELSYVVEKNLATIKYNEANYNLHSERIDKLVDEKPELAYLKDVEKIDTLFTMFSFFVKGINYKPTKYERDEITFYDIMKKEKGKPFDKSRDYSNEFIVETKEEKLFKKAVINSGH